MTATMVAGDDERGTGAEDARHSVDVDPRCWRCGKLLARFLTRPYLVDCQRCGTTNVSGAPKKKSLDR